MVAENAEILVRFEEVQKSYDGGVLVVKKPKSRYSQRRISDYAVARALVFEPKLVLVDERRKLPAPVAFRQRSLRAGLNRYQAEGRGMVDRSQRHDP